MEQVDGQSPVLACGNFVHHVEERGERPTKISGGF
jgi:hypothetical protein